jgi:hypothetical protein
MMVEGEVKVMAVGVETGAAEVEADAVEGEVAAVDLVVAVAATLVQVEVQFPTMLGEEMVKAHVGEHWWAVLGD